MDLTELRCVLIHHLRGCVSSDILTQLAVLPEGALTGFETLKLVLILNFIWCHGVLMIV